MQDNSFCGPLPDILPQITFLDLRGNGWDDIGVTTCWIVAVNLTDLDLSDYSNTAPVPNITPPIHGIRIVKKHSTGQISPSWFANKLALYNLPDNQLFGSP